MIKINQTGNTFVIALTPETREERDILNRLLDIEKSFKRTKEEEHDFWTIKPKAKKDDVIEYTPEEFKKELERQKQANITGYQMSLFDEGFRPVTKEDEIPFDDDPLPFS